MKTHIKHILGSYESLVGQLKGRQANLFNMEQVHPLTVLQSEDLHCEIPTMIKVYELVIADLKRLL
jgi:hypothetical protein